VHPAEGWTMRYTVLPKAIISIVRRLHTRKPYCQGCNINELGKLRADLVRI
jgi:hypothetical protein